MRLLKPSRSHVVQLSRMRTDWGNCERLDVTLNDVLGDSDTVVLSESEVPLVCEGGPSTCELDQVGGEAFHVSQRGAEAAKGMKADSC